MSLLLLIGMIYPKKKLNASRTCIFQSSLIGGFVRPSIGSTESWGILPEFLCHWAKRLAEYGLVFWRTWFQVLSFFGTQSSKNFGRIALSAVNQGGLVHQTQVCVGSGLTMFTDAFFAQSAPCFWIRFPHTDFHGGAWNR
ncbi:hypothetical protein [Anaeromassilibacillus sp. SJQ-1]|uniref:hypothetical protein n=1 Tax=Anaeromassilibacillus sp. SJQ-1 TaxID=3375419 RepID=UPI0039894B6A